MHTKMILESQGHHCSWQGRMRKSNSAGGETGKTRPLFEESGLQPVGEVKALLKKIFFQVYVCMYVCVWAAVLRERIGS